jgi:hypothetical protein
MANKTLNAKLRWMQFEDVLAPRLGLTVWDRAVYSYLLRHSLVTYRKIWAGRRLKHRPDTGRQRRQRRAKARPLQNLGRRL